MVDWDSVWPAVGTYVGSASAAAIVLGIVRGVYGVLSQRGPRKRVEAIKDAQDAVAALPPGSASAFLAVHRERELEALGRLLFRRRARALRWRKRMSWISRPLFVYVALCVGGLAGVGLVLSPPRGGLFDFTPLTAALNVVALVGNTVAVTGIWAWQRLHDEKIFDRLSTDLRQADGDQAAAVAMMDSWVEAAKPPRGRTRERVRALFRRQSNETGGDAAG